MNRRRKPVRPDVTRAIGYIRVSSGRQALSGAGLESQRAAVVAEIERRGWVLVEVIPDEGRSGGIAPDRREGLGRALRMLENGEADALVALKIDRVSRSVLDFSNLVARSERMGWQIITLDMPMDPNTPMGKAMRSMLATFAQLERDMGGERTAEALAVKREQGVILGRRNSVPEETRQEIRDMRAEGMSWPRIAAHLNTVGIPTGQGGAWHPMTCKRIAESDGARL